MRYTAIWFIVMLLSLNPGKVVGDEFRMPASQSLEGLRRKLLETQGIIHSIALKYHSMPEEPNGAYLNRIVVAKEPNSLRYELWHGIADVMPWIDDPKAQIDYVNADRWVAYFPFQRKYFDGVLRPNDPLPGTLREAFFFMATGLWPLPQRPSLRQLGHPCALRDVAMSDKYRSLRSHQEQIGGSWCHVLENPGVDRLWIDVERGCSLVARELLDEKGVLVLRYDLRDHRETAPGIWIPTIIVRTEYGNRSNSSAENERIERHYQITLNEVEVNGVKDEVFFFQPGLGCLHVKDHTSTQVVPGGEELMDEWVRWNQRYLSKPRATSGGHRVWIAVSVIVLAVTVLEMWRRVVAKRRL